MVCSRCTATDDKLACKRCWSRQMQMCEDTIACLEIHLKCFWCNEFIPKFVIQSSALFGSHPYNREATRLQRDRLVIVLRDRNEWRHRAQSLARSMNLSVESVRLTNLAPDLIDSENEAEEDAPDLDGVSVAPALEIEAVPLGGNQADV
jgi:hypothetical protein